MKKNDWYNVVFITVTTCLLLCILTVFITSVYAADDCKTGECPANCVPGILYGCKAGDPRLDACGQSGDEANCGGCECKKDSAGQCGCML